MTHTALRVVFISLSALLVTLASVGVGAAKQGSGLPDSATLTQWIQEAKQSPKGPFQAIKWFCADGTILPPKAYACAKHGGGIQHGLYTDRIAKMRKGGYAVANLIADLKSRQFAGKNADLLTLSQILVERYLVGVDSGWIFRNAYTYRGAFQIEDEEAAAGEIVAAMILDPAWRAPERYLLLRESVRLLPLQSNPELASKVRNLAIEIAKKDSGFAKLRAKIHGAPEHKDAASVRSYAKSKGKPALASTYEQIARDIESLYATAGAVAAANELARRTQSPKLGDFLRKAAKRFESSSDPSARIETASRLMAELRGMFEQPPVDASGLQLLQASLAFEREFMAAGDALRSRLGKADLQDRVRWLGFSVDALYGAGFLNRKQLSDARGEIDDVASKRKPKTKHIRELKSSLSGVAGGSSRNVEAGFGQAVAGFASFEPLAGRYPRDRLNESPMAFFRALLDSLDS